MKIKSWCLFSTSLAFFASSLLAQAKLNILFILADDLGFSDLSSYGSEIPTPHIDSLAAHGIRFSHYYTSPMCITTRAALLSGMEYMAARRIWISQRALLR